MKRKYTNWFSNKANKQFLREFYYCQKINMNTNLGHELHELQVSFEAVFSDISCCLVKTQTNNF